MDNKEELWTKCDGCDTAREKVRTCRDPDGRLYQYCDGCIAQCEDIMDLITEINKRTTEINNERKKH